MRSLPLLAPLAFAAVLGGCAREGAAPAATPSSPPPIVLVVGEPAPPPPLPAPVASATKPPAPAPVDELSPEPETLPKTWTEPVIPGLSFTDAAMKARAARDALERLPTPSTTAAAAAQKAWFTRAQVLADQASRMYAGAFHAPDASREGRIDVISEAAELDMTMARVLDEQNLGTMPPAWRSDPAVAGTFEDVEVGPTRRWRNEARVLARQCIDTAKASGVATDAARRCEALRTGVIPKRAKQDASAGCACSPGDPLCSASLGGWCQR